MGCSKHWQGLYLAQSQKGLTCHQGVIAVPALPVSITVVFIGEMMWHICFSHSGNGRDRSADTALLFGSFPYIRQKRHCGNHAGGERGFFSSLISYRIPYQVNSGCLERYAHRGSDIESKLFSRFTGDKCCYLNPDINCEGSQ